MMGPVNSGSGGSGAALTVTAPAWATVTVTKDGKTYTRTANAQGKAVFPGLKTGNWSVTISDGVHAAVTRTVTVTADYGVTMAFFAAYIDVTFPAGSHCCVWRTDDWDNTVQWANDEARNNGRMVFMVPTTGDYGVQCETDGQVDKDTKYVQITADGQAVYVTLSYRLNASDFNWATYGTLNVDYQIVYDDDTPIPQNLWGSVVNWKARLLTSNTTGLIPAKNGYAIDVFCVGGGGGSSVSRFSQHPSDGGGGGGGYVSTQRGIVLHGGSTYPIIIGAGGAIAASGGVTSAFGIYADGGKHCHPSASTSTQHGGAGGSGGGGRGGLAGNGGSDGGNGTDGRNWGDPWSWGGPGSGVTTREFGEANGRLYAGGGGGADHGDGGGGPERENGGAGGGGRGYSKITGAGSGSAGEPNTGGGGGGGWEGGSGIVIIRNAR